jgi:hypothetical protein
MSEHYNSKARPATGARMSQESESAKEGRGAN